MSSLTLSFNEVNLTPVANNDSQIWLTSAELAKALNYKSSDSVTRIFNRNKDEFSEGMAQIVSNPQAVNLTVRIFSLRGCHLIAMFARTDVAKAFRKWVLDILDREVNIRTDAKQRESLVTACDKLAIGNTLRSDVYTMVANHFGYEKVTQIPAPLLPEAVAFTYEMILVRQKPSNANDSADKENSYALSVHMMYCKHWFDSVRAPLEALNPVITRDVGGHFEEGMGAAKLLNRSICNM